MDLALYFPLLLPAALALQLTPHPGANISETTNSTRTPWPTTGGSLSINGSHSSALTYLNLGLGRNVTNFNISLVADFNQTGAGVLCLKDAVRAKLEEGLKAGNISGGTDGLDGVDASLQVIQISHSGSALYNVSGEIRGRGEGMEMS